MVFGCEVVAGDIKYDPAEILDVKWLPIEELGDYDLRMSKEVIDDVLSSIDSKNMFPLDVIKDIEKPGDEE
jgi:NADH pyrophosphatase NudC (nudix superfamily)